MLLHYLLVVQKEQTIEPKLSQEAVHCPNEDLHLDILVLFPFVWRTRTPAGNCIGFDQTCINKKINSCSFLLHHICTLCKKHCD